MGLDLFAKLGFRPPRAEAPAVRPGGPATVADLPPILDILSVGGEPHFIVLAYAPFMFLAAAGAHRDPPDVVSLLQTAGEPAFVILRFRAYRDFVARLDLGGTIDEADYLRSYPDVAGAVRAGTIASATAHFVHHGYFERRRSRLPRLGK